MRTSPSERHPSIFVNPKAQMTFSTIKHLAGPEDTATTVGRLHASGHLDFTHDMAQVDSWYLYYTIVSKEALSPLTGQGTLSWIGSFLRWCFTVPGMWIIIAQCEISGPRSLVRYMVCRRLSVLTCLLQCSSRLISSCQRSLPLLASWYVRYCLPRHQYELLFCIAALAIR